MWGCGEFVDDDNCYFFGIKIWWRNGDVVVGKKFFVYVDILLSEKIKLWFDFCWGGW